MVVKRRIRRRWAILLVLLAAYIGSYLVLSRRGFAQADEWNAIGFYFFTPRETTTWRVCNYGCAKLYYPLIVIDNWLGIGRPVASEPLWHLS
jgi:hypothetical protein